MHGTIESALRVEWRPLGDLGPVLAQWSGLASRAIEANVFYEPAFAVLAKWFVRDRERAFTILTLAAGLASTIFNPISSMLAAMLGWRHAVLALAAFLGATTIPMHAFLLRGRRDAPVDHQRRRAVVIESGYAKDAHGRSAAVRTACR